MTTIALIRNTHLPVDTTNNPATLTLPTSGVFDGDEVSCEKYDASTNALTVTGNIEGVTGTQGVALPKEILAFRCRIIGGVPTWWPIGGYKSKAALDGLYIGHIGSALSGDNQSKINALLDTVRLAGGGTLYTKAGEAYGYGFGGLIVGSGTHLEASTSKLLSLPGSNSWMIRGYGTANPVATATDGAVAAGSGVVTTSLAAQAVVGQTLMVTGAGATTAGHGGSNPPAVLTGVISAVDTTAGTITLAKLNGQPLTAGITVTAAAVKLINRDSNIRLTLGMIDRGANGASSDLTTANSLHLRHIDGLHVDLRGARSTGGKYAVAVGDCSDVWGRAVNLNVFSDGFHLEGPINVADVEKVAGITGDDLCALTANDYSCDGDVSGDVVGVTIGTLHAAPGNDGHALIIAAQGGYIGNVQLRGKVQGSQTYPAIYVGDYDNNTAGHYGDLDLRGAATRDNWTSGNQGYVWMGPGYFDGKVQLRVLHDPLSTDAAAAVRVFSQTQGQIQNFADLDIEIQAGPTSQGGLSLENTAATYKELTLRGSSAQAIAGSLAGLTAGTIDRLVVEAPRINNATKLSQIVFQGATVRLAVIRNMHATIPAAGAGPENMIHIRGGTLDRLVLDECYMDSGATTYGYPVAVVGGRVLGTGLALAATGDTVTATAHGLTNGQTVQLNTIVGATGVSAGVQYYVVGSAANTFQLSLTSGGAAVDITADGTATVVVGGNVGEIEFRGGEYKNTRALVTSLAGGTAGGFKVILNGPKVDGSRLCEFNAAGAMAVDIMAARMTLTAQPVFLSGATLDLTGRRPIGTFVGTNFVQRSGSEKLRIDAPEIQADISTLTPNNNDTVTDISTAIGRRATYVDSVIGWLPIGGVIKRGTFTFVNGVASPIANGSITATTRIRYEVFTASGTVGKAYTQTRTVGTSFTPASSAGDNSTWEYSIERYS